MSNQLNIGIVGAAGRGSSYFGSLNAHPAATVQAVCDLNEEGVRAVEARQ